MTIRELVTKAHMLARQKGWYEGPPRNIGELLALVHSEVSEALEAYRTDYREDIPSDGTARRWFDGPPTVSAKPIGFASELADIVIRVADLAGYLGIDLEAEIERKHAFNLTRSHRHGGKRA